MSAGTKIFLALFGVLIAALVLYYTTVGDADPAPPVVRGAEDPLVSDMAAAPAREEPRLVADRGSPGEPSRTGPSAAEPAAEDRAGPGTTAILPPDGGTMTAAADERSRQSTLGDLPSLLRPIAPPGREAGTGASGTTTSDAGSAGGGSRGTALPAMNTTLIEDKPQPPRYTDYFVRPGDTMSSIAEDWFGDADKWDLVAKANPLLDPNTIQPGDLIRLPPREPAVRPAAPARSEGAVAGGRFETVRSGDTLSSIAQRVYGSEHAWRAIYVENRALIGPDPDRLRVGMRLRIPPR